MKTGLLVGGGTLLFLIGMVVGAGIIITDQESKVDPTALPIPEAMKAQVYFEVAEYYFNQDEDPALPYDLTLAREYYTKAVELDPKLNQYLWYQFGRIDFIEGHFEIALSKFDKQLELFGERLPNVWYMKGLTYGYRARTTNDPEDWRLAEVSFRNFLDHVPSSPWARTDLAWVYFAQGKYEEMKPILKEGLVYKPGNAWLLNMYGLALFNTGDSEEALKMFEQAQANAKNLTEADWGESYPGNHPDLWGRGLKEFRDAIAKNISLVQSSSQSESSQ